MVLRTRRLFMNRISYVTDIEGNMQYFQQYISLTSCVRWGLRKELAPAMSSRNLHSNKKYAMELAKGKDPTILTTAPPGLLPCGLSYTTENCAQNKSYAHLNHADHTLLNQRHVELEFTDDKSHFVFGGDAFDNGRDIGFAQACIDFKLRYPDRVHLILGNRDLNKIAMVPLIYDVEGMTPDEAESSVFPLRLTSGEKTPSKFSYAQFLRDSKLRPPVPTDQQTAAKGVQNAESTASKAVKSELPFQAKQGSQQRGGDFTYLRADRISFLKWALIYKMGSPDVFEHRRQELAALKEHEAKKKSKGLGGQFFMTPQSMVSQNVDGATLGKGEVTDGEVAESFFNAARPGGVYYEYIRLGVLATVLFDSILFVHGGVNGKNVGFVPDIRAITSEAQQRQGRNFVDEGRDAFEWVSALNAFKDASFEEWSSKCGLKGEAARLYVFPRQYIPFSVTVGSIMETNGPQYLDLRTAHYLLSSGIEVVCTGHQPTGDTPALVRQPGGLLVLSADNSYCGRGNEYCTLQNRRGRAVVEVLIESKGCDDVKNGPEGEKSSGRVTVRMHGRRANGEPFDYIANDPEDHLLGRELGDGWWAKVPLNAQCKPQLHVGADKGGENSTNSVSNKNTDSQRASFYELHRTRDTFRSEETCIVSREEAEQMLKEYHTEGFTPQSGKLKNKYTTEDLAPIYTTRMKTRVRRYNTVESD